MISSFKDGDISIIGMIPESTNGAIKITIDSASSQIQAILKPDVSIRELWDFPNQDLNDREYATYLLSQEINLNVVPETVIKEIEGVGRALIQEWVIETANDLVIVKSPDDIPEDYLKIIQGYDQLNKLITVAHKDDQTLRKISLFDLIINNADRKGGHLITDDKNSIWAIDHGVTWHEENKIRTVLWGWIGQNFNSDEIEMLKSSLSVLKRWEVNDFEYLSKIEILSAKERVEKLLENEIFPSPTGDWPAVPWPIF